MKLATITAISLIVFSAIDAGAKADKSCWTGSKVLWPESNLIGWSPLVPVTSETSGGAVAFVQVATWAHAVALVKVTSLINNVPTSSWSTNTTAGGFMSTQWAGSVTLPPQVLCDKPSNWGQVQVWLYEPGAAIGGDNFYAYAAAKIQGN